MGLRANLRMHRAPIFAGLLMALFTVEVLTDPAFTGHQCESLLLAAVFSVAHALVRRAVLLPLVAAVALVPLGDAVAEGFVDSAAFLVAVLSAIYLVGRHADEREFLVGAALVAAAIPVAVLTDSDIVALSDVVFFGVFFGGPLVVGRFVRIRAHREERAVSRASDAERDRDNAVLEERLRIARELHDVVAHSLNVIVLQARGGRSVLTTAPADTASALDAIEFLGKQGLDEMRRMLGMLREDNASPSLVPQPSLRLIDELASAVTASGLPVEIDIVGRPYPLSPGLDMSAYRIVQEGLTNALKHAGHAQAKVQVRYAPDSVELSIEDNGPGGGPTGGGHGLAGMRERVAIYGGTMNAGPEPEGGFRIHVVLPTAST